MTGDLLLGACTIESNGWTNAFNMSEACLSSLEADDDRQFYHHMQLSSSSSSSSSISASPAQYPQCSPYSVPRRLTDDPIDFVGSYNALSDTVCLSSSPDSGTESTTPPLNCIDLAGLDEFLNTNSTSNDLIYSRLDSCSSSRSVTNSAVDLATEFLNFSQNPSPTRSSCSDLISSPIVDAGSSSDTKISSCLIDLACDLTDFTVASVRQADTAAISSDISNGTTRFQCDLCGKCFNRKYLFDRHVQSHSGTKPYICAVCNRTFSQKSNLKQHMSVHKAW